MRLDLRRFVAGTVVYLVVNAVWLYGIVDQGLLDGGDRGDWTVLALVAALHVAFGYVVGVWPVILLPIVTILLVIPAGYPVSDYEPPPMWFTQAFFALVEIPCIALGVGLRSLLEHLRPRRTA